MQARSTARASRLVLVRHGESEGNRDRRFTYSPAVPLTDLGREQVRRAAAAIAAAFSPARVVTSPYVRARQTAEIIAAALSRPLLEDEGLREQSMGRLAGLPYETVLEDRAFDPGRRWEWRPPGGESLLDVQRRVVPVLDRLAGAHAGEDLVVVSHGGVMLALWAHLVGTWEAAQATGNAGIVVIEHDGRRYGAPRFLRNGDTGCDVGTLA